MAHQAHDKGKGPRMTFRLYEGTVTVVDAEDQTGMTVEDTVVRTTPLTRGTFMKLYSSDSSTTPCAAMADAGDDDIIGILVDSPVRGDEITATGTPTVAQRRKGTIELFGQLVRNVKNDGAAAIAAGATVGYSNATPGYFEAGTPLGSASLPRPVALTYNAGTAMSKFPVLFGYYGSMPNTG